MAVLPGSLFLALSAAFLVVFLHLFQPSDLLFPDLGRKLTPLFDTFLTQLLAFFCILDYTSKFSVT